MQKIFSKTTNMNTGQTFEHWMKSVDKIISDKLMGMTSADLPDMCYRDYYDDGMSPRQVAAMAIRSAME